MITIPGSDKVCSTMIDVVQARAEISKDALLHEFITDNTSYKITFQELDIKARAIAANLQKNNVQPGQRAILIYPPGIDLITAFFGCLYAGVIAVPVYPPLNGKLTEKLQRIVIDCQPEVILLTEELFNKLKQLKRLKKMSTLPLLGNLGNDYYKEYQPLAAWDLEKIQWLITDKISDDQSTAWNSPEISAHHLAFLQYTSGSTGHPKGVMVSHANLVHNIKLIHKYLHVNQNTINLVWLPPYHDMGLIGGILTPLFSGVANILMSPMLFLKTPFFWLKTITEKRATISGGPNFCYELCMQKITDEQKKELDLSSWELAYNGAEPIHCQTMHRFYEAFKGCGFRKEAFYTCYGLAESTLFVAGSPPLQGFKALPISQSKLQQHKLKILKTDEPYSQEIVSSGFVNSDVEVKIVHPDKHTICKEDKIGEIWIRGPSVTNGYWNKKEETTATYYAYIANAKGCNYLRTGDLGFIHNKNLYVTGRLKDLIIIRGKNYYPHDIEETIMTSHHLLKRGRCCAFSVTKDNKEQLVILCETPEHSRADYKHIIHNIKKSIRDYYGLAVHSIGIIGANTIAKTTSGKLRRKYMQEQWLNGTLSLLEEWTESKKQNYTHSIAEQHTSLENKLMQIFQNILNHPIKMEDKFIDLGGDSLTAAQIAASVQEQFNFHLETEYFFSNSSIRELAQLIKRSQSTSCEKEVIQPTPQIRTTSIPLSNAQQRLWFLNQIHPGNPFYNLPVTISLKGPFNKACFQNALNYMIDRHEILRTVFINNNGKSEQLIRASIENVLPFVDLIQELNKDQIVKEIETKEAYFSFDLEEGPLLRYKLVKMQEDLHLFFLTIHHIIADGWSLNLFINELNVLYNAYLANQKITLPKLYMQYADYSLWQQQLDHESFMQKQLNYWQKELENIPSELNLPFDKPIPAQLTFAGEKINVFISKDIVQQLKAYSHRQQASFYTTLLACFQILLAKYTKQNDFAIVTPAAQRSFAQLKNLIGFFINTLAIRAKINWNQSFDKHLQYVKENVVGALNNQDVPFEKVIHSLNLSRDSLISPLCYAMFILQQNLAPLQLKDIDSQVTVNSIMSKFPITLECSPLHDGLMCSFEYSTELFAQATIQNMANHWVELLEKIAYKQNLKLAQLLFLNQEENQKLIAWNQTERTYPHKMAIPQLFEEQVQKNPNNIALVFEDQQLTYQELNQKANQLAHCFINKGLKKGAPVGVYLGRTMELVLAFLATIKAGGIYMPLDTNLPTERLQFMVDFAKTALLLSQGYCPLNAQHKIDLSEITLSDFVQSNLEPSLNKEDILYIIYTSGSTGAPKGVCINHKAISNLISWQDGKAGPRSLSYASMGFDVSIQEFCYALLKGKSLHIFPTHVKTEFNQLAEYISAHQINTLFLPTISLDFFVKAVNNSKIALPSLQEIIVAGEALVINRTIRDFFQNNVHIKLVNHYGPSETHVVTSYELTAKEVNNFNGKVPIGKPIANSKVYILNNFQQVPLGVIGELYLAGDGLATGYLNRPDLTQERFIENPFASSEDKKKGWNKLYQTGDLCRFLPGGTIEYIGRIDYQVKIRGFRIECAEIEHVLLKHAALNEVVVLAREDEPGIKYLVAYLILKAKEAISDAALIKELKTLVHQELPYFMMPSAFVVLDVFPLTPNGKLDRNALPKPSLINHEHEKVSPRSAAEKIIAQIWAQVLKVDYDQISIYDNFFDIGGDSISSVRIAVEAKTQGLMLSTQDIFIAQTLENLAKTVEQQKSFKLKKASNDIFFGDLLRTIIPIESSGTKAPLFLIHPGSGLSFCYLRLKNLIPDQPIYAIQNPYFGKEKSFKSLAEMASTYIDFIKELYPHGPYQLGGWSFGGHVALEMAHQLSMKQEKVKQIIMIDTFNPHKVSAFPGGEELDAFSKKIVEAFYELMEDETGFLAKNKIHFEQLRNKMIREIKKVALLLQQHRFSAYKGRTILIKAKKVKSYPEHFCRINQLITTLFQDPFLGWEEILPQIELYSTKSNHDEVFHTKNIDSLKAILLEVFKRGFFRKSYSHIKDAIERNLLAANDREDEYLVKLLNKKKYI